MTVTHVQAELVDESRICGALNSLFFEYNVESFWEPRCYS